MTHDVLGLSWHSEWVSEAMTVEFFNTYHVFQMSFLLPDVCIQIYLDCRYGLRGFETEARCLWIGRRKITLKTWGSIFQIDSWKPFGYQTRWAIGAIEHKRLEMHKGSGCERCDAKLRDFRTPKAHKAFSYNFVKREKQELVWLFKDFVGSVRFVHPWILACVETCTFAQVYC